MSSIKALSRKIAQFCEAKQAANRLQADLAQLLPPPALLLHEQVFWLLSKALSMRYAALPCYDSRRCAIPLGIGDNTKEYMNALSLATQLASSKEPDIAYFLRAADFLETEARRRIKEASAEPRKKLACTFALTVLELFEVRLRQIDAELAKAHQDMRMSGSLFQVTLG